MRGFPASKMSITEKPASAVSGPERTDLEAEIKKLEEELARKKLEEEIRQLELQLQAAKTTPTASAPVQSGNVSGDDEDDEYIVIEEIVSDEEEYVEEEYYEDEEYEDEEIIEEIVEEIYDDAPVSEQAPVTEPEPPKQAALPPQPVAPSSLAAHPALTPPPAAPPAPAKRDYPPQVPLVDEAKARTTAPVVAAEPVSPRKKWVPLSQRKPELFSKGPNVVVVPGKNSTTPAGSRPPVKFTPRKIPNLPESPKGQETLMEQLLGPKLITNSKLVKMSTNGCLKGQQLVCIYFGAGWRTECKQFNPLLSDFYKLVSQNHNIECVYIPADRTLFEFKDCYGRMPYLAMPAGTTALKNDLTKKLKVVDLPTVIVMDPSTGDIVTNHGVDEIMALENRNPDQANDLATKWKEASRIAMSDIKADKRLKNGNLERGTVYWQE
jgi:nucleoredoxin